MSVRFRSFDLQDTLMSRVVEVVEVVGNLGSQQGGQSAGVSYTSVAEFMQ